MGIDISNPISDVANLIKTVAGKYFDSKEDQVKLELALKELEQHLPMAQIDVNKEEAKSSKLFVAGWRPFIGWVCGIGLGYEYLIRPFLLIFHLNAIDLNLSELIPLLGTMLGFGAMRSFDKMQGTTITYQVPQPIAPPKGMPDIPPPESTK